MTEQQEEKVYEDTKYAEKILNDLRRELSEKGNTLMENIDVVIYVAMKLKEKLNFVNDTKYIKEIIETYEGSE